MWWLRKTLVLTLLVSLAACGFQPIYGKRTTGADSVVPYVIHINAIGGGRPGQELKVQLENLMNPLSENQSAEYHLSVALKEDLTPLVIERDRRISRYNLSYTAEYTLTEAGSGKKLHSGSSKITGSYDRVESDYATYAAQRDTANRVMREMAKDIKVRLMAHLSQQQKTNVR
jgi:LPS-assembly lipoprotein